MFKVCAFELYLIIIIINLDILYFVDNIEKENLKDLAIRLVSDSFEVCSSSYKCLEVFISKDAQNVAQACLEEISNFTQKEKKAFMIAKVKLSIILTLYNLKLLIMDRWQVA